MFCKDVGIYFALTQPCACLAQPNFLTAEKALADYWNPSHGSATWLRPDDGC